MKYIVTRTSILADEKPIEEAVEGEVHESLYSMQTHVEPTKVWIAEINYLREFIDKYGQIVLNKPYNEEGLYEIEIYDDYRE